ncbi:MAG TPA: PilN domain-containing protein [Burkholderiales bacterium]|nr:PilN domain-containing protein [Burkholderiales bacterium]
MQNLDLDFLRTRPESPWIRWVLLAAALAFTADLAASYSNAHNRLVRSEETLLALRHGPDGAISAPLPASRTADPDEIKIARDTVQRLSTPWDKLFRALESSANDKVALLSIDPEARTGTVLISGEAADYRAALEYVSQLGRAGALERPHLVHHERSTRGPGEHVRFTVSAAWREAQ